MPQPGDPNKTSAREIDFNKILFPRGRPDPGREPVIGTPDAGLRDPGVLTYEPYFGLREKPFSLSSDPRFFFSQASHGAMFEALVAGIRRREGILVLTGEVGTGKTTLCRAVLQALDRKTFAAFVPDPFLSREDLLKTLLVDFGVVSVEDIKSGRLRGASRTDLSYPLYEFLASLQPLRAFAVVMIDEAQNLPVQLLEEIRILADLEGQQKFLQVLLVGQPELQAHLRKPEMRQLDQRLSVRCELKPLLRQDIRPYILHRLAIAGSTGALHFADAAIDLIWAVSRGIPRVINLVCDRALLQAARASTKAVVAGHVNAAIDDLQLPVAPTVRASSEDRLGPILASLDETWSKASRAPELLQPPPTLDGRTAWPGADSVDTATSDLETLGTTSSAFPTREAPLDDQPEEIHLGRFPVPLDDQPEEPRALRFPPLDELADEARVDRFSRRLDRRVDATRRRRFTFVLAGAVLAVTLAGIWYRSWMQTRPPEELMKSAPGLQPLQLPSAPPQPADLLSTPRAGDSSVSPNPASGQTEVATLPLVAPAPAEGSTTREGSASALQSPALGQIEPVRFAIQMATFLSAQRAARSVEELRDAGFGAYSVETTLSDGRRVHAVRLGPYAELNQAERDLVDARQISGYDGVHVVPVPALNRPP